MATCTFKIATPSTLNVANYTSGSFTPAANDLVVVLVVTSGTVAVSAVTDSLGGGYSFIRSTTKVAGDTLYLFVGNNLAAASARTVTFNCPGNATGCIIFAYTVSGLTRVGPDAVRQTAVQANQTAAGTPAPAFGVACLTGNPTLGVLGNATNPATVTPPTSWTEGSDTGYATPTTGGEVISRDSGFTGTTVTWGSTSASGYGDIIVELDTSGIILPSVSIEPDMKNKEIEIVAY